MISSCKAAFSAAQPGARHIGCRAYLASADSEYLLCYSILSNTRPSCRRSMPPRSQEIRSGRKAVVVTFAATC
ncbi:hypothetical protein MRB53_037275 [Persea americana]|nr:hypothetical protein MRB53_037275 [Persea americana]